MTGVTELKGEGPKVLHEGPIYPFVARTLRNRPSIPSILVALMLWGAMVCGGWAQTREGASEATFHSDAAEVRMTFSTTDQDNRVMATIQSTDFAVVDHDVVVRDFRSFARSQYTRLEIALLVDASDSITPQFRRELANVLQIMAETSGVPEESISVVSFRDLKPTVVCEGNCRALSTDAEFSAVKSGGLTPLYDSIVFASRMLERHAPGRDDDARARKVLILFSDGADTISLRSFNEAMREALNDEVAIYSVDVSGRGHNLRGTPVLRNLSAGTGGRYFPVEAGGAKIIDAILGDFHATYTVAYKLPSHATGFHQVRILPTHNLSLQFHCRLGYYYSSAAGD
jgi:VWFA-related protein